MRVSAREGLTRRGCGRYREGMSATWEELGTALDETALEAGMSGVISIDVDGSPAFARAYGLADRAHGIPNTLDMRFGSASVTKGFTGLAVMSLVQEGALRLDTTARSILCTDLPLIDDSVTIEHLLSHTSGIGDYFDEEADWEIDDYVLTTPVHQLDVSEAFVPLLDGYPQKNAPGERFLYNNGAFVVLALIAERASGVPYHDLVQQRVFEPAALTQTAFLRLNELPGDAAVGYLFDDPASLLTNVLHLPIRGNGDGGAFTSAADLSRFWRALADGRIVDAATRDEMIRPRNVDEGEKLRYGLGFYLDLDGPGVILQGYDAGVSALTRFDPTDRSTITVLSNSPGGAWPIVRRFNALTGA